MVLHQVFLVNIDENRMLINWFVLGVLSSRTPVCWQQSCSSDHFFQPQLADFDPPASAFLLAFFVARYSVRQWRVACRVPSQPR